MSKYIKKDENGFYVFDEIEFSKTLPTGLEYFAVDKETEQIYNLGFNYKEKMEKQIADLEAKLAESERKLEEYKKCNCKECMTDYEKNLNQIIDKFLNENIKLKQQLAEKEKEIERLNACVDFYKSYYISFREKVIDELEKVKDYFIEGYAVCKNFSDFYWNFTEQIDNQIEELKKEIK